MKIKEFAEWYDSVTLPMTDSELCACFEFHLKKADLELQTAIFQDEWRQYELIRLKELQ